MNQSKKPVMLYDGDCGFCKKWIKKWEKMTQDKVIYHPYAEVKEAYPNIKEEACRKAVQLIMPDNNAYSGAHAVFKTLCLAEKNKSLLWLYEHLPLFGPISEFAYKLIAKHRGKLSKNACDI
jgi:lipase maturation factor 1